MTRKKKSRSPSGSRSRKSGKSSGQPELPTIFLDRSLGSDQIAIELRSCGYTVHTMREVYSEKTGQRLADVRWLKKCAKENWVVFSKDKALRNKRTDEHRAVMRYKIRGFLLPDAQMKEREQIRRYVDNRFRIALRARKEGPYLYSVEPNSLGKDYLK